MFIDWLPEALRPWRTAKIRAKHGSKGGWRAPDTVPATVEMLEPLQMLSAAPITQIARDDFLTSQTGYLSGPSASPATTIAQNFLMQHRTELGLTAADVTNLKITSQSVSSLSGATHIYFQQTYNGIPVQDSVANITVASDGKVLTVGNNLVPDLAARVNTAAPTITPANAAILAGGYHGLTATTLNTVTVPAPGSRDPNVFHDPGLSRDDIPVTPVYVVTASGEVRQSWNVVLRSPANPDWLTINIDGQDGTQVNFANWTVYSNYLPGNGGAGTGGAGGGTSGGGTSGVGTAGSGSSTSNSFFPASSYASTTPNSQAGTGSYNVYPFPIESPDYGARTQISNPEDSYSSPFGWHDINGVTGADFTDTRGNNVFAQEDLNGDDVGGNRPDGGTSLNFDFAIDLTQDPTTYTAAATTQLFYANNVVHDVMARYGFDAAAGNFQLNNYGQGGLGNDQVMADAQDGSGANNANFATPPDGQSGRMQMFIFTLTTPNRDGDLDNEIIIHEYGHGVSNRLTGGAANSQALNALQSRAMGEGWSDYWALMLLQQPSDQKLAAYPTGTYVLGQPTNGPGVRSFPYSYDMVINPHTYADYNLDPEEHAAGEIWASVLWDLNWNLIDKYGFTDDLYTGNSGNNRALSLVMEGLKIQPANPSFLDARDAILAADKLLYGGANQYTIWQTFARRGMGFSANDGGSANALTVTEAFDVPATPVGELSFDQDTYEIGDTVTITLKDIDLAGSGSQTINVTSSAGDLETVTLTEVRNGGIFIGQIVSRSSETTGFTILDGLLEVPRASTISISYLDANDGTGASRTVTDTAAFYVLNDIQVFDFSDGTGAASNDGFTSSGTLNLWHVSQGRGLDLGHTADDSFYFGQNENANGGGNYLPNSNGTLTSPLIDLTNFSGPVFLKYNQFLDLEDINDTATVSIISPAGTTIIATNNGPNANMPDATGGFQEMRLDISAFAGQKIRVAFQLQSNGSVEQEGWYVDDVTIAAPLSIIEGTKYNDVAGNGQFDFGDTPLEGWRIFLDHNNNGSWDNVTTVASAAGLPASIPDGAQLVTSTFINNVIGPILDVNVSLSILHNRTADMDVFLISPSGTRIELFTDVGVSGANFVNTTLDDQANFSINQGAAPYVGSFSPESLLAALNGEDPNGQWSLEVNDDTAGEIGALLSWSITVTTAEAATLTDANGKYSLSIPTGGTFRVREQPQSGWVQTSPSGATPANPNPAQIVTVPFGQIATGVNFFNQFVFPVVILPGGDLVYTENDPPQSIDSGALINDVNSPFFSNGSMTVSLTQNATPDDFLIIANQGTATGLIGVSGNQVSYGGTVIGTFSGGQNGTSLVILFNANASRVAVQALLRAVQFYVVGDTPSPLTRTLQVTVTDDTNGTSNPATKLIQVIPVNDLPVVTVTQSTLIYAENSGLVPIDTLANVTDPDSPNFGGGYLQVSLTGNESGPTTETRTVFNSSSPSVVLDNNTINSAISVLGLNGALTDVNVTVNITHSATTEVTAYLISPTGTRVKLFSNAGNGAIFGSQNFTNTTLDDEGELPILSFSAVAPFTGSFTPEKELFVLDGQNPNGFWTLELTDAVGQILDGNGTLDSWSIDLETTEISTNEILSIINQGSSSGSIGLVGNRVTYGGTVIGTYSGGVGTTPLRVDFNSNATQTAVRSLMRNVALQIIGESPILGLRQAQFIINDGDGGTSVPAVRSVSVVSVNDAPVLTLPGGIASYVEGSQPTLLDLFGTVTDEDSVNFDTGTLTASLNSTAPSTDRLAVRSFGVGTGQINVSGSTLRYGTATIGTISGGTSGAPLVVTFNANATPDAVQALVRALTFQSPGSNPTTTPRILSVQVTDGDGGSSALVTKTISVVQTNDAPVLSLTTVTLPPDFFPESRTDYNANGQPVALDPNLTISDGDTAVFSGGVLTVTLTGAATSRDRLVVGNKSGVTVFGSNVSFGGVIVGQVSGGVGIVPLTVTFNNAASIESVQAVARAVTYSILGPNAQGGDRTATFQVSDGAGGSSVAAARRIVVQIVNLPPINGVPDVAYEGMEDEPIALSDLGVFDPDANSLPIQVVLAVQNGTLLVDTSVLGGVSAASVVGNGTSRVTITADQAALTNLFDADGIEYLGNTDFSGQDQLTMTTNDLGNTGPGGALNDVDSVFINVQSVFDTASITTSAGTTTSTRGREVVIDPLIKANLAEATSSLGGSTLIVQVTSGKNKSDRMRIISEGDGEGQIRVVTSKKKNQPAALRSGGVKIGSITGGTSGKPLTIKFNDLATLADLQRVLKLTTFATAVKTTVFGARTLSYTLVDALGLDSIPATKVVDVVR